MFFSYILIDLLKFYEFEEWSRKKYVKYCIPKVPSVKKLFQRTTVIVSRFVIDDKFDLRKVLHLKGRNNNRVDEMNVQ